MIESLIFHEFAHPPRFINTYGNLKVLCCSAASRLNFLADYPENFAAGSIVQMSGHVA
jgi:hypothetical protein